MREGENEEDVMEKDVNQVGSGKHQGVSSVK